MSGEELTPEQSAQLAVDGAVVTDNAVCIEAGDPSEHPDWLPTLAWQNLQWMHLQGDEIALLEFAETLWRDAYDLGFKHAADQGGQS